MSTLKDRNLHFETKQLHVGQEQADPVTDARAVPMLLHHMYSTTASMPQTVLHCVTRVIFTADLQTLHRPFLKKE